MGVLHGKLELVLGPENCFDVLEGVASTALRSSAAKMEPAAEVVKMNKSAQRSYLSQWRFHD